MDFEKMDVEKLAVKADKIKFNISKVIVGKDDIIDKVLAVLLAGGHLLLEDTPGTGKTMLAKALAASISADFGRIQFTPDLLPADVTGLNIYNRKDMKFEFSKGPVFSNILLADEINRATPRTQSALLECMEEKQVTVDGDTYILDKPFFLIATQNPIETAGTYPLPEAQMDRFYMQLSIGYPTLEEELDIIDRYIDDNPIEHLTPVCTKKEIVDMMEAVKTVFVHKCLRKYIAEIVGKTRESDMLLMGVNTRGTLAYLKCAMSYAAIKGRNYVTPDDVKSLAIPVLGHRVLTYMTGESKDVASIIKDITESVTVPTEDWTGEGLWQ